MFDEADEHIQVSDELEEIGSCTGVFCDSLELASGPDRKKTGQESRADGMAWACCSMRGWRESMEDASLMLPVGYLGGNWRNASLFGVFDGHGGEQVARFTARQLPDVLAKLSEQNAEAALTKAFLHIDEMLWQPSAAAELRELTLPGNLVRDSAETCGTTAVCCLIQESDMILAHAGDSRAVLCREAKAVRLTEDHKPELPGETARIEAAGGFVQEEATSGGNGKGYRVNGNLNLSRALGDLTYKDQRLKPHEHMVSGVPETRRLRWQAGADEFVLLACDGVWECMTDQQAVNFIRARLPSPGSKKGLVPVLEELLDACCASTPTQRGGLGCDNISAVLIRFEDPAAAAAEAEVDEKQAAEVVSEARSRQLEAALSQTIQRLAAGVRKKESQEQREARLARERRQLEEEEARRREELEQEELRRKRRAERATLESQSKKRLKCCAAFDEEDENDEDL